jgi:hypothetical protein
MKSLKIIKIKWLWSYIVVRNTFFINHVYRVGYKTITYVHLAINLSLKHKLVKVMLKVKEVMEREVEEEEVIDYKS